MDYSQLHCSLCRNLRYSQMAPVTMFAEKNTKSGPQSKSASNAEFSTMTEVQPASTGGPFGHFRPKVRARTPSMFQFFSQLNHIQLANQFDLFDSTNSTCLFVQLNVSLAQPW